MPPGNTIESGIESSIAPPVENPTGTTSGAASASTETEPAEISAETLIKTSTGRRSSKRDRTTRVPDALMGLPSNEYNEAMKAKKSKTA